ncbi:hypothetical protein N781_16210 [Pontibacillus halophilus JSM 076056 = DSM 19796]|uniref:Glycolipid-binding domain-containing protein n=1 Tax=Pontibacillus halophilus JSM 076056 = DSM 19796 TaxID=1385510 RepID=A0A0A5GKI1_9BACI|nr:putative glycolipid-binding domain-containing protein [Pontibacillus halophilus]KGX92479.1 hypothetical protein N781_16210 [Pontibacillus halophilus JSM 076056 = DSM 19796]
MDKTVFWTNLEQPGAEYLTIRNIESDLVAESLVLFMRGGNAYKFSYQVVLDQEWFTKRVDITDLVTKRSLYLRRDWTGEWYLNGSVLEGMDDAIDVDISMTPFSNTLPINRCTWERGQVRVFTMLYVDVPSMELEKVEQTYTFLGDTEDGYRRFRYTCKDYETVVTVDREGIIVDYPDAFRREFEQ